MQNSDNTYCPWLQPDAMRIVPPSDRRGVGPTAVVPERVRTTPTNAKIVAADVRHIRKDTRLLSVIATDYGVSLRTIQHIRARKTWGDIV